MNNTTRNDVKKLAAQIEVLAREVQDKLESGADVLDAANELVRNNMTFVFSLGEVFALEQVGSGKTVSATAVSNPNKTARPYHNVRDSRGRFVSKV